MATVLTTTGDTIAVNLIRKSLTCSPQFVKCATCAGTANAADTGLFAGTAHTGVEVAVQGTDASATNVLTYTASITFTGTRGITNAGSFITSSSNGEGIFVHGDHAEVDVLTNDVIAYTISCTLT